MARGVSENFLRIARREQRLGRRAALAALLLAPLAAFLADLADDPAYGPVWGLFLGTLLGGLCLGLWLTQRRIAHYEDGLRLQWNHWMRHAANASRLTDVERKVQERDPPPALLAQAGALGLALLNALLFALLWVASPAAQPLAWLTIALDGLVLGALVTSSALLVRWAKDFVLAAEDLVQKGEVAMWGER
jgi:hypothetical protein